MKIDFLGIGAQRAGTTWIASCLREHEAVFLSRDKELHYFDEKYEAGWDWYAGQFAGAESGQKIGEVTPSYLTVPGALERIAEAAAGVKLFAVLRDPVARAYSAYQLFADRYTGMGFVEAVAGCDDLKNNSSYADHMTRLLKLFDRERVHVALYEQMSDDPEGYMRGLYGFIGVDDGFRPSCLEERYNRVMYPRTQAVMEKVGLGWAKEMVKGTAVGSWIKRRHAGGGGGAVQMSEAERDEVRAMFAADVERLEEVIGLDLSRWK